MRLPPLCPRRVTTVHLHLHHSCSASLDDQHQTCAKICKTPTNLTVKARTPPLGSKQKLPRPIVSCTLRMHACPCGPAVVPLFNSGNSSDLVDCPRAAGSGKGGPHARHKDGRLLALFGCLAIAARSCQTDTPDIGKLPIVIAVATISAATIELWPRQHGHGARTSVQGHKSQTVLAMLCGALGSGSCKARRTVVCLPHHVSGRIFGDS